MRPIDADALIESFWSDIENGNQLGYGDTERLIYNAPTLDPAQLVPQGEWEWRGGIPWCSNCGKMPSGYSYDGDVSTTDFCPNCGARMRKEAAK